MSKITCSNCGKEIEPSAAACPKCGQVLSVDTANEPNAAPVGSSKETPPTEPAKNAGSIKRKVLMSIIAAIVLIAIIVLSFVCFHEWSEPTCTTPSTCTKCGNTRGDLLPHTYKAATCTDPEICSVCNKASGKALDHDWQDATCTTPQTCSKCSATQGSIQHDWSNATCTEPKTCNTCGIEEGNPLGHKWQEASVSAPKTCSLCKITEGEPLPVSYFDMSFSQYMKSFNKNYKGTVVLKKKSGGFEIDMAGGDNATILVFGVDEHSSNDVNSSYSTEEKDKFNALKIRLIHGGSQYDDGIAQFIFSLGSLSAMVLDSSLDANMIIGSMDFKSFGEIGMYGHGSLNGFDFEFECYNGAFGASNTDLWYEFTTTLSAN